MTGGNGACHCVYVSELLTRVDAIELRDATTFRDAYRGGDPWQPGYGGPTRHSGGDRGANYGATANPGGRTPLPLRFEEPLGSQLQQGKNLFDDKLTTSEDYRFNGVKGGFAWKGKTERH